MADGDLKVSDFKVYVQNVKLFFTQTSEHFQTLEVWKISKLWKKIFKDFFFFFFFDKNSFLTIFSSRNFPLLSRPNYTWNGKKWPFQIFSDNFSQKDYYKFGMAKNGHSEIFLTIFSKKTGINSKWPEMAVPNFSDNFSQKDCYKLRMAKNGHSKFF